MAKFNAGSAEALGKQAEAIGTAAVTPAHILSSAQERKRSDSRRTRPVRRKRLQSLKNGRSKRMSDYIRREDARRMVVQLDKYAWKSPVSDERRVTVDVDLVKFGLDRIPAADVAEVVPAQWEEADWREYDAQSCETIRYPKAAIVCTNCRCAFKKDALWSRNHCPNCGAKMDGGCSDD